MVFSSINSEVCYLKVRVEEVCEVGIPTAKLSVPGGQK